MRCRGWTILMTMGLCVFKAQAQGQDSNADTKCLEDCLGDLQQHAPSLDAASVLSIGHIRSGNQTVMCPRYDAQMMNSTCGSYRDATKCFDKCPSGVLKTLSTSGFAPLQLICIDRKNDFDRYMPCLSENCASIEGTCQPKCGSFDNISKDILQLVFQIRGGASPAGPSNGHIDPNNVTTVIDKVCEAFECYADCSRAPTIDKCGKDAYTLEMETVWTIFASVTQSMSSIGLSTPWPESCKTLQASAATWTKSAATSQPEDTHNAQPGVTRSNSVDQFVQKNNDDTNATHTTTQKCHGADCGSASGLGSTTLTLLSCLLVALILAH